MKKFFVGLNFILAFMIFLSAPVSAEEISGEKIPLRIARLPIIFQSGTPNEETISKLEMKMSRAVHIPLNGTLKLVEYIDPDESLGELQKTFATVRAENRKAKFQDAVKPLAEILNADIVICPVVMKYHEYVTGISGIIWESQIFAAVEVGLTVYDKRTDELIYKKCYRGYSGSTIYSGYASFLADECFDKVIAETGLKQKIMAIKST